MDIIKIIFQIVAGILVCLSALMSIMLFVRLRWPAPVLWFLKLYTSALSPLLVITGVFSTIAGLLTGSAFLSIIGMLVVLIFFIHIHLVTRQPRYPGSFEKAFGLHWEDQIDPDQKSYFLPTRNVLKLPVAPRPRLEQNIPFATIPGTNRQLLCDIWQPNENIPSSGLAFIYLHGGAWYLLDKDVGSRPFFSQLAAQGHVIMDVAYRLAPETDMMGMVHDAKRAIAWMRENAGSYGINPDTIVIGGGSAGAHLALLAAYTSTNQMFTTTELEGKNMNVCAVISLYGPADLKAMYYHTNQHLTTHHIPGKLKKVIPAEMPQWIVKKMGRNYHRLGFDKGFENGGDLASLLGCHPDECPATYSFFSPVNHIDAHCPPTLLIHGAHDIFAPVNTSRFLYTRLIEEKIPAVIHIIPQVDHAFDLVLPELSPSAHNALYDVERFLALQVTMHKKTELTANNIHSPVNAIL